MLALLRSEDPNTVDVSLSLKNLDGLDAMIEETVDHPDKMEWFDFSFNELTTIDDVSLTSSRPYNPTGTP